VPFGAGSLIRQTAIFDPVGVLGQLYWYVLYPIHQFVFAGMLKGIVRAIDESHESREIKKRSDAPTAPSLR